jgi:hypothetical protein
VVNPFSLSTFSRCAACSSFSKVMFFVIVITKIAMRFRCKEQLLSNLGTISYTCTAPLGLPSRDMKSRTFTDVCQTYECRGPRPLSEGGKASVAVQVGSCCSRTPPSRISTIHKSPKTAMISHDMHRALARSTTMENTGEMSGETLRGRGLGVLDVVLGRGNCRRAVVAQSG